MVVGICHMPEAGFSPQQQKFKTTRHWIEEAPTIPSLSLTSHLFLLFSFPLLSSPLPQISGLFSSLSSLSFLFLHILYVFFFIFWKKSFCSFGFFLKWVVLNFYVCLTHFELSMFSFKLLHGCCLVWKIWSVVVLFFFLFFLLENVVIRIWGWLGLMFLFWSHV